MPNDTCEMTESMIYLQDKLCFIVYYIVMPTYFFVAMFGNMTLLLAFHRQAKTDKAYAYQVFLTISKVLETFFSCLFWWAYKWHAGEPGQGAGHSWYMNNYVLMFYAAYLGCFLSNGFIIMSLLFSVAMTADRVFALAKPFVYKIIRTKRHQALAACCCVFIGLAVNLCEVKRRMILPGTNTTYVIAFDEEY